jgi:hypothetical protein
MIEITITNSKQKISIFKNLGYVKYIYERSH